VVTISLQDVTENLDTCYMWEIFLSLLDRPRCEDKSCDVCRFGEATQEIQDFMNKFNYVARWDAGILFTAGFIIAVKYLEAKQMEELLKEKENAT